MEVGRVTDFQCEYRDILEDARIVYVYDMQCRRDEDLCLAAPSRSKVRPEHETDRYGAGRVPRRYDDAGSRERGTNDLMDQLGRSLQA